MLLNFRRHYSPPAKTKLNNVGCWVFFFAKWLLNNRWRLWRITLPAKLAEVSAHEFLSFPQIQLCTERRIQLCAVRKTLRKQLPVLHRLTQIYNMRIQVTMTCGGSPPGRVWEGTSHPGSLREWIPSWVPPGRGCPAAARFFFKQEA